VVVSGLPGTGESILASGLATEFGAALLSVDPVESALHEAGIDAGQPVGLASYVGVGRLAAAQLAVGTPAVVDAVLRWRRRGRRCGRWPPPPAYPCSSWSASVPMPHCTAAASRHGCVGCVGCGGCGGWRR